LEKVGFYIYHGVEVRYFLLSGLVDEIRRENDVCLYIHQEPSIILEDYAREYKVQLKLIPVEIGETPKFEGYLRAFTNSRKRINDVSIYSHFGYTTTSKFYDSLFKISFFSLLGNRLFRFFAKYNYKDKPLMDFLKSEGLSRIYLLQYDSIHLKKIGVNAALIGIENYVFINTLKTLFIDDFVAFPIKKLFSWNGFQNRLFQKANVGFGDNSFEAKGSPYHTFLLNRDNDYQATIIKKYNLDFEKPIVLYSLLNEKVYASEHLIIEKIVNYLENTFQESHRPQLIIRRNPFEQKTEHIEFLLQFKNIIVADHYWERDENKSWSIQERNGELEWRALLQLASLSMNIPSMATIDSIVCGTPVVTIGFDERGEYNRQINYLIDSPYNKEFNKSEFVVECNSLSDFGRNFENAIQLKRCNSQIEIKNSLDIAVNEINQFL